MKKNPLGESVQYIPYYDKTILYAIPRNINRTNASIDESLFYGQDLWNCYEFSFLNKSGKPLVYKLRITYDAHSTHIVESKSLKLYLGSFIMTKFDDIDEVVSIIKKDLESILNSKYVFVGYFDATSTEYSKPSTNSFCVDHFDISCNIYNPDASLLKIIDSDKKEYSYSSHLLKTNCPITGQPDWASVYIDVKSEKQLTAESFLKYIVSYREHGDYHETCCEKIYNDLYMLLRPQSLTVTCNFTRRGGIDINPIRSSNTDVSHQFLKQWRQ